MLHWLQNVMGTRKRVLARKQRSPNTLARPLYFEVLEDRLALSGIKAFYGAEGFGSLATGGRGGDVYTVTNLNASGPGSLQFGINQPRSGPRTIVFAVGGEINLNGGRILLRGEQGSNLTIAGQTAPGKGITIRNGNLEVDDAENVIVRHLAVRWGNTSSEKDSIWIRNANNVIFDHVSATWGYDETLSITRDVTNITIQNSIIAEGIRAGHQYGSLINSETIGGGRITLYANLYLNQLGRMPRAASQNGESFLLDMVNNVVYNWGRSGDWGTQGTATSNEFANWNLINNYHIAGPDSALQFGDIIVGTTHLMVFRGGSGIDNLYASGNKIDSNRDGVLDGVLATTANYFGNYNLMTEPFPVPEWAQIVNLRSADDALLHVIYQAGARPWNRDTADLRMIVELASWGTMGSIKTSVPSWPSIPTVFGDVDTDGDGMPDWWEEWYGSDPLTPNNNTVNNAWGYTDLEQYLQWIVDPSSIKPLNALPIVEAVYVSGTAWTESFRTHLESLGMGDSQFGYRIPTGDAGQLQPIPWNNVDRISIHFNEPVHVQGSHLHLEGTLASYQASAAQFEYDPDARVATWTFPTSFGTDKLRLILADGVLSTFGYALDGDWSDGESSQSGNGQAGGDFRFRLNILPGNASNAGMTVTALDWNFVRSLLFTAPSDPAYSAFADINGSGGINPIDWNAVRAALFSSLVGIDEPEGAAAGNLDTLFEGRDTWSEVPIEQGQVAAMVPAMDLTLTSRVPQGGGEDGGSSTSSLQDSATLEEQDGDPLATGASTHETRESRARRVPTSRLKPVLLEVFWSDPHFLDQS